MREPGCAVGGGPPARRPRRELRSVRRLEARPGSAAQGRRSRACVPSAPPASFTPAARLVLLCVVPSCLLLSNFACNSPVTISVFELASLELQCFWALLKVHAIELHAEFLLCVSVVTREVAQPRATASSHAAHPDRLLLSG